jgi:hypothetical protein
LKLKTHPLNVQLPPPLLLFYRRRLDKEGIKFGEQAVGVNKLSSIMKTMCSKACIEGYYTNHSGKRTCATTLYQAGKMKRNS